MQSAKPQLKIQKFRTDIVTKILLLLALFIIPLLGANSNFGYEHIKILSFIFSISLIGFVWLLKKPNLKWNLVRIASAIFIFLLLAVSIAGTDLRQSFLGSEPYFQGWLIYAYLGLFSVMVASSRIDLEVVAKALVFSASLVSIAAIRQWFTIDIFHTPVSNYAGRVVSTFGQPNFFAGFLLLTLPFSYYLFTGRGNLRILGWVGGLLSMIGILVSFSRSAILLALLLLILGLIDQLKIKLKFGLIVLGIIFISIFLALRFSSGLVGREVSQAIQTKNPDLTRESVEKRVYIWPVVWEVIKQQPFTGYGLENIGKAFTNYFEQNKYPLFEANSNISPVLISLKELNIDRSHNYILDLLLFGGVLGLLGWLGLVGLLFWKFRQTYRDPPAGRAGRNTNVLLVSLIVYLVWVQFQNQSIMHLIYFWLLVGLIDRT